MSTTTTVRLHRVLRASPDRIYRAFLDPEAMAKWLPPHGFTAQVHQMDAKVGGSWRMHFTNFGTRKSHSFGGKYLELVPGEMQTTVTLKSTAVGTEMNVTQEGIPAIIPPEACYLGWQESLTLLAQLVEPELREK